MKCPECNSTNIRKNGIKRGKQNHICYDCRRQFVIHNEKPPGYSDDIKKDCLKMYVNGMGFRAIERVKGIRLNCYFTISNFGIYLFPKPSYRKSATPKTLSIGKLTFESLIPFIVLEEKPM